MQLILNYSNRPETVVKTAHVKSRLVVLWLLIICVKANILFSKFTRMNQPRFVAIGDSRSQMIQSIGNWLVNYSSAIGRFLLLDWILTVASGVAGSGPARPRMRSIRFSSLGTVSRLHHPTLAEFPAVAAAAAAAAASEAGTKVPRDAWQDLYVTLRLRTLHR